MAVSRMRREVNEVQGHAGKVSGRRARANAESGLTSHGLNVRSSDPAIAIIKRPQSIQRPDTICHSLIEAEHTYCRAQLAVLNSIKFPEVGSRDFGGSETASLVLARSRILLEGARPTLESELRFLSRGLEQQLPSSVELPFNPITALTMHISSKVLCSALLGSFVAVVRGASSWGFADGKVVVSGKGADGGFTDKYASVRPQSCQLQAEETALKRNTSRDHELICLLSIDLLPKNHWPKQSPSVRLTPSRSSSPHKRMASQNDLTRHSSQSRMTKAVSRLPSP